MPPFDPVRTFNPLQSTEPLEVIQKASMSSEIGNIKFMLGLFAISFLVMLLIILYHEKKIKRLEKFLEDQ